MTSFVQECGRQCMPCSTNFPMALETIFNINFRFSQTNNFSQVGIWRWSSGAMVLGKLLVPGRPTNLVNSRPMAYCACSRSGWRVFGHFSLLLFSLFFLILWLTAQY